MSYPSEGDSQSMRGSDFLFMLKPSRSHSTFVGCNHPLILALRLYIGIKLTGSIPIKRSDAPNLNGRLMYLAFNKTAVLTQVIRQTVVRILNLNHSENTTQTHPRTPCAVRCSLWQHKGVYSHKKPRYSWGGFAVCCDTVILRRFYNYKVSAPATCRAEGGEHPGQISHV